jgi:hypothetical protein
MGDASAVAADQGYSLGVGSRIRLRSDRHVAGWEGGQIRNWVRCAEKPPSRLFAKRSKEEYLTKVVLFGEGSLRRALGEYVEHYHAERNHQGKGNILLFPRRANIHHEKPV